MAECLWTPPAERIAEAQMSAFMELAAEVSGRPIADYAALYQWSIDAPAAFWELLWDVVRPVHSVRPEAIVDDPTRLPGAQWFPGARLNFAENLLQYRDDRRAIVFRGEAGSARELTYRELYTAVARMAALLRARGVGAGDRVAALLPNVPEAVIGMLATASIGAIWSSCSPDFGPQGVLDRFRQIDPKVLLVADGYRYAGKDCDAIAVAEVVVRELPSLACVFVVAYLRPTAVVRGEIERLPKAELLDPALREVEVVPLVFAQLPFDHPLYILYSSGTTGVPKCIVHGAGGTLLQHEKEHLLHTDLRREDVLFYFTTCGWMMWNWLVSALAVGCEIVLYDGSPFHPSPARLFDLADELGITVFGVSARFLSACEKAGLRPNQTHRLRELRTILSTGSPLSPEGFRYVYRDVKDDVQLASICGGTDIVSCFFLGEPTSPVYAGELQCRGLGMRVEAVDATGRARIGERGELVCTLSAPSMPIGFWNDPDGARYRAAYFERFPSVWHHGDFVEITPRGTAIVSGRSDATLNPGGVRIGTAEIYRQVEALDEIADSIVVGRETGDGDVSVVLFVKLRPTIVLDEALRERIRERIRRETTPRHVPRTIVAVDEIPYTISGKKVELAVRELIHGRPVHNRDALANPECLDAFAHALEASP